MYKILYGYITKNKNKFAIMIFAITISTMIIFGTSVSKYSQLKYTEEEINKQIPDCQMTVYDISRKDVASIERDANTKNSIIQKYCGDSI
ncbi:MAG: hypothetical protein LBN09_08115 [Clostridioides sp.]|jgi:GMP synthase PP-ATPase subunit|nr:hypothetical protein [Clostridioides sp.]